MIIYSLQDYKHKYNKSIQTDDGSVFYWDYDLFIKDPPETYNIEVNNKLIKIQLKLTHLDFKKRYIIEYLQKLEGLAYITIKKYFETPEGQFYKKHLLKIPQKDNKKPL